MAYVTVEDTRRCQHDNANCYVRASRALWDAGGNLLGYFCPKHAMVMLTDQYKIESREKVQDGRS